MNNDYATSQVRALSSPASASPPQPESRAPPNDYVVVHAPLQASAAQYRAHLRSLTAVPASGAGKIRKRKARIVAKFYNEVGPRPYPPIGALTQSISVQLVWDQYTLLTTSTTLPTFRGNTFTLANFANYSNYLSLFDQYRIDRLEVWIEPRAPQGTTAFGALATAVDLDDGNTPASSIEVLDKPGALVGGGAAGRYHSWVPHMAVATYSGAFTSYANEPASWIDSGSPNVQHFGLKTYATATAVAIDYDIRVRAHVTFRAPGI